MIRAFERGAIGALFGAAAAEQASIFSRRGGITATPPLDALRERLSARVGMSKPGLADPLAHTKRGQETTHKSIENRATQTQTIPEWFPCNYLGARSQPQKRASFCLGRPVRPACLSDGPQRTTANEGSGSHITHGSSWFPFFCFYVCFVDSMAGPCCCCCCCRDMRSLSRSFCPALLHTPFPSPRWCHALPSNATLSPSVSFQSVRSRIPYPYTPSNRLPYAEIYPMPVSFPVSCLLAAADDHQPLYLSRYNVHTKNGPHTLKVPTFPPFLLPKKTPKATTDNRGKGRRNRRPGPPPPHTETPTSIPNEPFPLLHLLQARLPRPAPAVRPEVVSQVVVPAALFFFCAMIVVCGRKEGDAGWVRCGLEQGG